MGRRGDVVEAVAATVSPCWRPGRPRPLPDYDSSDPGQVSVGIAGRILDERHTRLLMERTDLPDLAQMMLLDRVQMGQPVSRNDHRDLKSAGLVEGRYSNVIVAAAVARTSGEAGRQDQELRPSGEAGVGAHRTGFRARRTMAK